MYILVQNSEVWYYIIHPAYFFTILENLSGKERKKKKNLQHLLMTVSRCEEGFPPPFIGGGFVFSRNRHTRAHIFLSPEEGFHYSWKHFVLRYCIIARLKTSRCFFRGENLYWYHQRGMIPGTFFSSRILPRLYRTRVVCKHTDALKWCARLQQHNKHAVCMHTALDVVYMHAVTEHQQARCACTQR